MCFIYYTVCVLMPMKVWPNAPQMQSRSSIGSTTSTLMMANGDNVGQCICVEIVRICLHVRKLCPIRSMDTYSLELTWAYFGAFAINLYADSASRMDETWPSLPPSQILHIFYSCACSKFPPRPLCPHLRCLSEELFWLRSPLGWTSIRYQ